jgi:hypothetical protein
MITWAFVMRQLSIILAPGYNLILAKIPPTTFHLGSITLNLTEESAPGALLCVLWTLFEVLLFLCYFNMATEYVKYKEEKKLARRHRRKGVTTRPAGITLDGERTPLLPVQPAVNNGSSYYSSTCDNGEEKAPIPEASENGEDNGLLKVDDQVMRRQPSSESTKVRWIMDQQPTDGDAVSLFTPVVPDVIASYQRFFIKNYH